MTEDQAILELIRDIPEKSWVARWPGVGKYSSYGFNTEEVWLVFGKPEPTFDDFQAVIEKCKQMQEAIRWQREWKQQQSGFAS